MSVQTLIAEAEEVDFFAELTEEEKLTAEILANIAMLIHNHRMELNLTQEEFARENGVSQAMVSKWESGDYNFTVQNLTKILNAMGKKISIEDATDTLETKSIVGSYGADRTWKSYTDSVSKASGRRMAMAIA